jgi:hypothetical protein
MPLFRSAFACRCVWFLLCMFCACVCVSVGLSACQFSLCVHYCVLFPSIYVCTVAVLSAYLIDVRSVSVALSVFVWQKS